jgi:hypothetical protein
MYYAINIDVKFDLDLRYPRGAEGIPSAGICPSHNAVGHFPLTLQNMNIHRGLVVGCRSEHLTFGSRDGSIPVDYAGKHPSQSFDAQRQGSNVQQHYIGHISARTAAE